METRAKYLKNKLIRGGIVGVIISFFLIFNRTETSDNFYVILALVIFISIVWLTMGFWLRHKLTIKEKSMSESLLGVDKDNKAYLWVDRMFSILFILIFYLMTKFK